MMRMLAVVLTLLGASALATSPAAAQNDLVLEGRALGPDGAPLPGQEVLLHQVAGGSGSAVATDTADANGRFQLNAEGRSGAIYFVAARWQGELYIGPTFQAPVPDDADYVIQVGVPGTSASALMGGGSGASSRPDAPDGAFPYREWLYLLIPLLVVTLVAGYLMTRSRSPQARRRLLLRVARLDEAYDADPAADVAGYRAERRNLLDRLQRGV